MSLVIEKMLSGYHIENIYDQKNAMKEIMQEIVLCGLSRAGFFKNAAFLWGYSIENFLWIRQVFRRPRLFIKNSKFGF